MSRPRPRIGMKFRPQQPIQVTMADGSVHVGRYVKSTDLLLYLNNGVKTTKLSFPSIRTAINYKAPHDTNIEASHAASSAAVPHREAPPSGGDAGTRRHAGDAAGAVAQVGVHPAGRDLLVGREDEAGVREIGEGKGAQGEDRPVTKVVRVLEAINLLSEEGVVTRATLAALLAPTDMSTGQLSCALFGLASYKAISEPVIGGPITPTPEADTRQRRIMTMRGTPSDKRHGPPPGIARKFRPRVDKPTIVEQPAIINFAAFLTPPAVSAEQVQMDAFVAYWSPLDCHHIFGAKA